MPISNRLNPALAPVRSAELNLHDQARSRLIVALDFPDAASAIHLVDQLEDTIQWFKVGLELFISAGPAFLEPIVARGHSVFLDLKLHDIPNTVAGAVKSAAALGARMLTVHASGGPAMLVAAREALHGLTDPPELLAVTVLTSMDSAELSAIGHRALASRAGRASGTHGDRIWNPGFCLFAPGSGFAPPAHGTGRGAGYPGNSAGRRRDWRSETYRISGSGSQPGCKLPCCGPPNYPGSHSRSVRRRDSQRNG